MISGRLVEEKRLRGKRYRNSNVPLQSCQANLYVVEVLIADFPDSKTREASVISCHMRDDTSVEALTAIWEKIRKLTANTTPSPASIFRLANSAAKKIFPTLLCPYLTWALPPFS
jgi:hypothetical protein